MKAVEWKIDGYRGLIEGEYKVMKQSDFSGILTLGGTILGTSRQPFKQINDNSSMTCSSGVKFINGICGNIQCRMESKGNIGSI